MAGQEGRANVHLGSCRHSAPAPSPHQLPSQPLSLAFLLHLLEASSRKPSLNSQAGPGASLGSTAPVALHHSSGLLNLYLLDLSSGNAEGRDSVSLRVPGLHPEARGPPVPMCSSQCAAVCMVCAVMGHLGMEAACALLDTLDPAVTKVSSAAGIAWAAGPRWTEKERSTR